MEPSCRHTAASEVERCPPDTDMNIISKNRSEMLTVGTRTDVSYTYGTRTYQYGDVQQMSAVFSETNKNRQRTDNGRN
jgi:hypothetical protein